MKKAQALTDMFFAMLIMFVFAITMLIGFTVVKSFNTNMQGKISSTGQSIISNTADTFTLFDKIYVVLFISTGISLFVTFTMIDTHPVYFVVNFLLMGFLIIIAAQFSNILEKIGSTSSIVPAKNEMPYIERIYLNYPPYLLIIFGVGLTILYAKWRSG